MLIIIIGYSINKIHQCKPENGDIDDYLEAYNTHFDYSARFAHVLCMSLSFVQSQSKARWTLLSSAVYEKIVNDTRVAQIGVHNTRHWIIALSVYADHAVYVQVHRNLQWKYSIMRLHDDLRFHVWYRHLNLPNFLLQI